MPFTYATPELPVIQANGPGYQGQPSTARLEGGGYVLVWRSNGANPGNPSSDSDIGIFAQRFTDSGQAVGPRILISNDLSTGGKTLPDVAGTRDGGFAVTYSGNDSSGLGTYLRVFNPDGSARTSETRVNVTTAGDQSDASVAVLSNGTIAVVWTDASGGFDRNIMTRLYGSNGQPLGGEFQANSASVERQNSGRVIALADGGYAVAWDDTTDGSDVVVQRFNMFGARIGGEVRLTGPSGSLEFEPAMTLLANGEMVVAWQTVIGFSSQISVQAQRFSLAGEPIGAVITMTAVGAPTLVALPDGGFTIIAARGTFVQQRFDAAGNPVGDTWPISGANVEEFRVASATALADGSVIVTYDRFDSEGTGIHSVTLRNASALTNGNDRAMGTSGADRMEGLFGNDELYGGGGDDFIDGVGGADAMHGGAGNDTFIVDDAGDRVFEGVGGGSDEVRTALATYTLAANVEALVYTGTGAASLRGNFLSNTITGGAASDLIRLDDGGSDTAFGGAGNDGFFFGAFFDSTDQIDGGEGRADQIGLQGVYDDLRLGSDTIRGVELIVLLPGSDTRLINLNGAPTRYTIGLSDGNVAAGATLIIQANTLRAGENFTLNGSNETNGSLLTFGGFGTEMLTGGQKDDGFFFGTGRFGANDRIDGQGGTDQLGLQGDYTGANALTLGASQLASVEFIVLLSASDTRFGGGNVGQLFSYDLTMNDGNVAAGQRMIIQANSLQASEVLIFDGSRESDGAFQIFGGLGGDTLVGGQRADDLRGGGGSDRITGGAGGDTLRGGEGTDTFVYRALSDSNAVAADQIIDFATGDLIDFGALQNAVDGGSIAFIGNGPQTGGGQLQVIQNGAQAVIRLFADGDATADLVINVTVADGHTLSASDFVGVEGGVAPLNDEVPIDLGGVFEPIDPYHGWSHDLVI